jgi:pimeloyl-ACP methyl ester carboxylesterase
VTTQRLAGDALRVLDELEVEEANVFGISLGGMIATWLGILAPGRVQKLCIASAPARGLSCTRTGLGRLRHITTVLRDDPAPYGALVELALASVLHDTEGKLHRIRAQTLVLAGQNDKVVGTDCSRVLARAIPRATFEIIPNCGHDLTLEQPHTTAERLARFLLRSS